MRPSAASWAKSSPVNGGYPGGCDQPASRCEAHHVIHRADGGHTSLWNLKDFCSPPRAASPARLAADRPPGRHLPGPQPRRHHHPQPQPAQNRVTRPARTSAAPQLLDIAAWTFGEHADRARTDHELAGRMDDGANLNPTPARLMSAPLDLESGIWDLAPISIS